MIFSEFGNYAKFFFAKSHFLRMGLKSSKDVGKKTETDESTLSEISQRNSVGFKH